MINNIEKLTESQLVEYTGEKAKLSGMSSGLDAQQAQAELTKRLIDSIRNFDDASSRYSKILLILTMILMEIGISQILITLFQFERLWEKMLIYFIILLGFIILFIYAYKSIFNDDKKLNNK
ncbi:MAG: hypothetical protein PHE59_01150 [Patescibacteria group bacterium]|nr:hypothetical protein [Patescibacteria group bacterium]MDD5164278.1 hypothetical protein [Patescibacteria group bacterium]MDD5535041.1 hypothetical protein [Patescibacteria group bacterium]